VISRLLVVLTPITLFGCSSEANAVVSLPPTPKGLEAVQMNVPAENPLTPQKVALGKMLFFDKRLAKNGSQACQSCHVHEKAWTDGLTTSPKFDGSANTRNSPSLYNVAYQPHFYWDGRAATLEANIEAAWKNQMGGDPDGMAKTLAAIPGYATAFANAFPGTAPTGTHVVRALASFLRTLQSGGSAYDLGTMSEAARRGEKTFSARCASCHLPPLFTDFQFHNTGIGDGKDVGRLKQEPENKARTAAFKTPGLRGVSRSAPYFHDGSAKTLRDAVALMAKAGVDNEHLDPILKAYKTQPALSDAEIDDLVAFLQALDSSEPFTAPTLPQ
jgi:cytochrome c peroxidase